jgi:hypothetical protein
VVLDANGWEQCGLNPDGSLKDAKDIEFGPDPGESDKEAGPSSGAGM